MSKHPLNKVYRHAFPKNIWKWDADRSIFVGGWSGDEWCLGDRRIIVYTKKYVGFSVDEWLRDQVNFANEVDALNFLKNAQHKEYGCRLWCEHE